MSSHKYKKRKRNYRHHKEDADLSGDDIDEHWTVYSSDSDSEDINEGKRLTSLVRKSYVQHLHDTLAKNFEECKNTVKSTDSTSNIQRWVTVMEQRALRSCMVAELYQKTMIHMISDIKRSTQQSKLHINSEFVSKLSHLLPMDKECQSEFEEKKVRTFSVETQTGKSYASLLDFPLPKDEPCAVSPVIRGQPIPTIDQIRDCVAKVTPVPRSSKTNDQLLSVDVNSTPYNPLIELSPCENSETLKTSNLLLSTEKYLISPGTKNHVPTMVPPPSVTNSVNFSKILEGITMKKDNSQGLPLKPEQLSESNFSEIAGSDLLKNDILLDLQSEFSDIGEIQGDSKKVLESNSKSHDILFDMLSEMESGGEPDVPSNSVRGLYSRKKKISDASISETEKRNKISKPKDCLDARLTAMGLLDDDDKDEIALDVKSKKSNWTLEFIAQSCNLTRIMLDVNQKKRKILINKFEKLFGLPHEPETELNAENIRVCRKRIASVVVAELTPMYQAKRIGSRHLFKFLAKHATTTIMQKSYAPETRQIRRHIQDLFVSNKDIESESDVLF